MINQTIQHLHKKKISLTFVRCLTTLALPVSLSRIIFIASNVVAMMMVGRLGERSLAAGVFALSTLTVVMLFFTTSLQALSWRIRHYYYQEKQALDIGLLVSQGFILSLALSSVAALFLWSMDKVLLFLRQDPAIINLTTGYFQFAALSMFPSLWITVINQFNIGIGKASSLLFIEIISFPLRVFFYYVFVLGYWGAPVMGLAGVGLSDFLVKLFFMIALTVRMRLSLAYKPYQFITPLWQAPNWSIWRSLLIQGIPIGLQSSGELAALSMSSYLMGYFGATALSALIVTNQYMIPVLLLSVGLSQALTVVISEMGEEGNVNIKWQTYITLLMMLALTLPFIFLFLAYPLELLSFFGGGMLVDAQLNCLTAYFFKICCLFILVEGVKNVLIGALRGLKDNTMASSIGLFAVWGIALPASYIGGFVLKGGPIGVRLGFLTGITIGVSLLAYRLFKKIGRSSKATWVSIEA